MPADSPPRSALPAVVSSALANQIRQLNEPLNVILPMRRIIPATSKAS
jgi:hypothetical protein